MKIIAFDGHDGSGKSTLAKHIAYVYGYDYVRPFSEPLGNEIADQVAKGNFDLASSTALHAVQAKIKKARTKNGLVLDRGWLSMVTVLPERLHVEWERLGQKMTTVVVWADYETTLKRLQGRNNPAEEAEWDHRHFVQLYKGLAEKYQLGVIDTSADSDISNKSPCASLAAKQLLSSPRYSRGFLLIRPAQLIARNLGVILR